VLRIVDALMLKQLKNTFAATRLAVCIMHFYFCIFCL
jgi:hypothetical protein